MQPTEKAHPRKLIDDKLVCSLAMYSRNKRCYSIYPLALKNARKYNLITSLQVIDDIIWNRCHSLECRCIKDKATFGSCRLPLGANFLTPRLSLSLQSVISLPALQEVLSTSWWLDMLNSHMKPLLYDPMTNLEKIQFQRVISRSALSNVSHVATHGSS